MRYSLLLPLVFLGLGGCAVEASSPGPAYVAVQPVYVAPAPIVVERPIVVRP